MPFSSRFGLIVATVVFGGNALAPRPALSTETKMAIAIEQNGVVVYVDKNVVTLHKAPFSIVSTLTGTQAVSVSVSSSDELLNIAKKHRLSEPFTNQFKALPLEDKNASEVLFVAEDPQESYAYYFYESPDDSRFNRIMQAGEQLTCTVTVSKLNFANSTVPVAAFSGKDLYLVFALTEVARGGKYKVTSSDYLHVRFEP